VNLIQTSGTKEGISERNNYCFWNKQ